jgi:phosphatidylglycerophosphatase A
MSQSRPVMALAIATVGGIGYAPIAPGTFGSAAGLVLWSFLPAATAVQLAAIALIAVGGAWAGTAAEQHFHTTDPGAIVVDEVAGMLLTLLLVPLTWKGAVLGFLLFRLFDIIKPFPARRLEQLHGGVGVMADDLAAAVYANLALRACLWLVPSLR